MARRSIDPAMKTKRLLFLVLLALGTLAVRGEQLLPAGGAPLLPAAARQYAVSGFHREYAISAEKIGRGQRGFSCYGRAQRLR